MPNIYEQLPSFSFGGIEFPWEEYTVTCGLRLHVHEYPHQPGGDPEKLGRKLYEIRVKPILHAGLLPDRYKKLFPETYTKLRNVFESQETKDLIIPDIGTMRCYCAHWSATHRSKILSGPDVEWVFNEDGSFRFSSDFLLGRDQLQNKLDEWTIESSLIPEQPSIFEKINDVALQILAIKDQTELYGALFASKVEGLVSLIQECDASVSALNSPDNFLALDALNRLGLAAVTLAKDILGKEKSMQLFTLPATLSISQVSQRLYGDTTHAVEIMQLNEIDNPLAIPAGEKLVYYA